MEWGEVRDRMRAEERREGRGALDTRAVAAAAAGSAEVAADDDGGIVADDGEVAAGDDDGVAANDADDEAVADDADEVVADDADDDEVAADAAEKLRSKMEEASSAMRFGRRCKVAAMAPSTWIPDHGETLEWRVAFGAKHLGANGRLEGP